jgi:filamentous hemagglutinin
MMDYLPEAARVTELGGQIIINGNSANKYFTSIPSGDQLGQLGLDISYQGELLPEFQGMSFTRTDGSPIDPATMRSIVFTKKP